MNNIHKQTNIGFVGLGKLGLPVALSVASKGYNVLGYDINEQVKEYIATKTIPYQEVRMDELFKEHTVTFTDLRNVIERSDIIFVPVQTPHDPMYEGITRIPESRVNFNYDALVSAIQSISNIVNEIDQNKIIVIISTVLPGTVEKYITPVLTDKIKLCYNPFFIAMGTTINDFLNPEFVLLGVDNEEAANTVEEFYSTIHSKKVFRTSIKNAELIKVAYNTYIGMKIAYANTMMEICHKTGANVDSIIDAICLSDKRLISGNYLRGGMGDGGGCHPRDNIAMSWLARELNLSHDFFEDLMLAREDQTNWLAELCLEHNLPIVILGKSFKPETNIQTGSPSILLRNILNEKIKVEIYDPKTDINFVQDTEHIRGKDTPYTYFIGTQHQCFKDFVFNKNSVVVDPFRYIKASDYHITNNIRIINIGI
jgi:UDPglucose 6-dehydrogenase